MANLGNIDGPRGYGLGLRPTASHSRAWSVSRSTLGNMLLHLAFFVALYRSTSMWFGYPSTQNENSSIDPAVMQFVLYSIIPIIGVAAILIPRAISSVTRHVSPLVIVFCGLILLSTALSRDLAASIRGLVAVIVISTPVLVFRLRFGPEHTMLALRRFAAAAIIVNFLYILAFPGYGLMGGSLAGSARGMFVHKNVFGQFSAVAFLLLLPFPFQRPVLRYSTLFYGGAALLALACVALSLSSTALALTLVGMTMLAFANLVTRVPLSSIRAYLFGITIIAVGATAYGMGSVLLETFAANVGKDATFSGRTEVWEALMLPMSERPLFGHGFALFRQPDYIARYTSQIPWGPRSTHNTYIEIALNVGLPAAAIWVTVVLSRLSGKFVRKVRSQELRNLRAKEAAVLAAIVVGAFTEAGVMLAPVVSWVILLAIMPSLSDAGAQPSAHSPPRPDLRRGAN